MLSRIISRNRLENFNDYLYIFVLVILEWWGSKISWYCSFTFINCLGCFRIKWVGRHVKRFSISPSAMLIFPALVSGSDYYPRYSHGKWSHDGVSSISTPSNVIRYRSQMFFTDYPSKIDRNSIRSRYPRAFQWWLQKRGVCNYWHLYFFCPLRPLAEDIRSNAAELQLVWMYSESRSNVLYAARSHTLLRWTKNTINPYLIGGCVFFPHLDTQV